MRKGATVSALLAVLAGGAVPASAQSGLLSASRDGKWVIRPAAQTNLWFHALAVIAADEPGPLGLYSADYARDIRSVKQQWGVYPTPLDSAATSLRRDIAADSVLQTLHFVPLYFSDVGPEPMLQALKAVARRRIQNPELGRPSMRFGVAVLSNNLEKKGQRRVLERLVSAVQKEWELFYRDYWEQEREALESRFDEMQEMWDTLLTPRLEAFLKRRRLTGGLVMPSPALGPEGRILELDTADPTDQIVAVQVPPSATGPEATLFAFLKELCFLLVDGNRLLGVAQEESDVEDLRRRAAVRCGALILDFYAPTIASGYRRTFLDAVGAEESATVTAFERIYYLEPQVYELVREDVRRR